MIYNNLNACGAKLEMLEMDHYSITLLQDVVAMLDGDGDGDIEADEFQKALAAQGRIVGGEDLLQPVADAKYAIDRLLECETAEQGYIELDAMALQLLGQDVSVVPMVCVLSVRVSGGGCSQDESDHGCWRGL